ncbi:hypothetical protein F4803DRAFT_500544 [Xylaria telfairii]|nr:hypothetical protein F4803DRAFT_500544 [Xylaria telfairii]
MITRTLRASALALWLLINHVLSQTTTETSPIPTISALISTSTLVSPLSNRKIKRGLTEDDKIGISVAVTFIVIILVGSIAILCVIRRRRKALAKPQTRALGPDEIDDETVVVGDDSGKGEQAYYMSPPQGAHQVLLQQAPDGTIYQGGGYPTIPAQTYAPQQQAHVMQYPTTHPGNTYPYSGTAYPGAMVVNPSHQSGYAGPSNLQYQPEAHLQQQQPQQQGGHISWIYPVSTTSPVEAIPVLDFQYKYLQDYQQQSQDPQANQDQYHNGDATSGQGYQANPYYVPPPHPHASELPDQRKPVELMGEGHYREVP